MNAEERRFELFICSSLFLVELLYILIVTELSCGINVYSDSWMCIVQDGKDEDEDGKDDDEGDARDGSGGEGDGVDDGDDGGSDEDDGDDGGSDDDKDDDDSDKARCVCVSARP